ncbi:hypothetical protein BH11PAT1_BH11PAT1_4860 [soil metagenome]
MPKKIDVSIIIVHYKVKKELFACIASIIDKTKQVNYEIIVVDNDEKKTIGKELRQQFPQVVYIPNPLNNGWGGGVNDGRYYAQGAYLYFLNPDTLLKNNAIYQQYQFIKNKQEVGIVSAALVNNEGVEFERMGAGRLTLLDGLVSLSSINTLFPKNPISQKHWFPNKTKNKARQIPIVPLAAAMISNELFKKVGMFDKRFFLYFEEYDLCRRIEPLKKKNYILTDAKVFHAWGISSKHLPDTNAIYNTSRFTYFKKYYGLLSAVLVQIVCSINKSTLPLLFILLLALFLRFYRLAELMPFIGDQGWFYLSARDMLLTGQLPLVGITSSHTWLHQGAWWTYILGLLFAISNYNPVFPGYVTAFVDVVTVYVLYITGKEAFSKKAGIVSALIYATSPLIITTARMPYHTSFIPLCVIALFYSTYLLIVRQKNTFPLIIFLLALLYNFEIATSVLWFVFMLLLVIGIRKKLDFISKIQDKKNLILSGMIGGVVMLPMFVYDLFHGFPQTLKYLGWIGYKLVGIVLGRSGAGISWREFFSVMGAYLQQFFFMPQKTVAIVIFCVMLVIVTFQSLQEYKNEKKIGSYVLLFLWLMICLGGVVANKTPSGAYLSLFFPILALGTGNMIDWMSKRVAVSSLVVIFIVCIAAVNVYSLLMQNYLVEQKNGYGLSFATRTKMVEAIISETGTHPFVLQAKGPGSQFSSFTMNTQFLLWKRQHSPTRFAATIVEIIEMPESYSLKKIAF